MPVDLPVAEDKIRASLAEIGLAAASVQVEHLTDRSFVVTIVSDAFEGQTFLDREMRVRPAIARAFGLLNMARAEFVIEPITEAEIPRDDVSDASSSGPFELDDDSRQGKSAWRRDIQLALDALVASHYTLTEITEFRAYIAVRKQLSSETIVIGFASSPRATTVDLETRAQIQSVRASQRVAESYYLYPEPLENPFANQTSAPWLKLHTIASFLHVLNSSTDLAQRLIDEVDKELLRVSSEHRGIVIEPEIRLVDDTRQHDFFEYVETWRRGGEASLLVMMAPAGHGKTTLSLELARRMAAGHLQSSAKPVPLVVPFEAVRRTVDFESLLYRRLGEIRPGPVGAFQALLQRGDAVLIVDGFDELADDAGFDVASAQIRSMKFLFKGKSKIILAGRSVFTQAFAGEDTVAGKARALLGDIAVDVIELQPFDDGNVQEYVNTREGLSAEQRRAIHEYCDASPDQRALASNPLFLKFLCSLAANSHLPKGGEVTSGADALLEKVCEREEERQHLGIGVAAQREFLYLVATEAFHTGKPLLIDDLTLIAELFASDHSPEGAAALRGKLVDHALLKPALENRVDFIHPLVRDVILGAGIDRRLRENTRVELGRKDLPEGTVSYLASRMADSAYPLPRNWLETSSGDLTGPVRRNLFRIVMRAAWRRDAANPRLWFDSQWSTQKRIRGIDLSGLWLQAVSFDGMTLESCDVTQTLFHDCDLRASVLDACTLRTSIFINCRAKATVRGGVVADVIVAVGNAAQVLSSPDELTGALKGQPDLGFSDPPPTDIRGKVDELARSFLAQLVDLDPPRFHEIPEDALQNVGKTDREIVAVSKVIQPRLVSKLCTVTVRGGSQRRVAIDRRVRSAVVTYLKSGTRAKVLQNLLGNMAAKAARFFT